jgi:hypothetical protein
MTTEPQNVVIPAWIHSWGAFVKHHEKLILIGAASLVLWHFGDKITEWFDNKHSAEQAQINLQIAQQETRNQLLQQELSKMQQSFNETILSLNAKIDAKKQAVIVQQKIDAQLPLPELSTRWESLLTLAPGNVTPQTNGTIAVSTDAAHATVNELEKVPQLTEQVEDTQAELKACTDLSAKKDESISGLKIQVQNEKDGRAADAKVAKDDRRKSFWKGTKFGSILTGAAAVAIKVAIFAAK